MANSECPHVESDACLPCFECRLASIDWNSPHMREIKELVELTFESFPRPEIPHLC